MGARPNIVLMLLDISRAFPRMEARSGFRSFSIAASSCHSRWFLFPVPLFIIYLRHLSTILIYGRPSKSPHLPSSTRNCNSRPILSRSYTRHHLSYVNLRDFATKLTRFTLQDVGTSERNAQRGSVGCAGKLRERHGKFLLREVSLQVTNTYDRLPMAGQLLSTPTSLLSTVPVIASAEMRIW